MLLKCEATRPVYDFLPTQFPIHPNISSIKDWIVSKTRGVQIELLGVVWAIMFMITFMFISEAHAYVGQSIVTFFTNHILAGIGILCLLGTIVAGIAGQPKIGGTLLVILILIAAAFFLSASGDNVATTLKAAGN